MRTSFTLASIFLFFSMLVLNATAVAFNTTSDPTSANAGQSSQLVNFTVSNNGSVNITQVNITLPPGFVFMGTSGTTTSSSYTASSTTPSWINSTSIGLVGNGATQYFWIYVTTPSTTGSYNFNTTILDASGAFNSSNVTFSLFDNLAPTYSTNTTSPSTNSTYSTNQTYWFNVTWSDNLGISKVLIEHNITGSGTPHNETMSNSSSVYYFNVTDLAAGTYVWRVYANDTNNTFNSTSQIAYAIRQATNSLNVYLNGSLNNNITSINNTAVNITANASCNQTNCNITLARDGTTIASVKPNPYSTNDIITTVGLHNYTVTIAGNTNYSSNSATYFVSTVSSYSTSTSNIPLTFSNTTVGSINITFDTNPSLSNIHIQGDWSGTATNYTMSNSSGTGYYYNITFPAGTYTWKIYGVYSNHSFNLIALNSFTINKAAPKLILSITPQWTLDSPIQTNVSCTVDLSGLTVNLYRNGTSITNQDVQTFSAGSVYDYLCNNTVNQNYTSETAKNTLIVKPKPSASLTFVEAPKLIEMIQNSTASSEVKVKNNGNVAQNITLELAEIDATWYSLDKTTTNIFVGATAVFKISFNIPNADVKDYTGKFNVNGTNGTVSQEFTLRVLPSVETKLKINDSITLYKLDVSKLESRFDEIKNKVNNTASIEQKLNELKSAVKQAEDYTASDNYFQAQQTFETIKALISEVESQLKVAESPASKVVIPSKVWLIVIGTIVAIVAVLVAYLFWPVKKGYKPETGKYSYGPAQERKGLLDRLKNFFSKFKHRKKTETVLPES